MNIFENIINIFENIMNIFVNLMNIFAETVCKLVLQIIADQETRYICIYDEFSLLHLFSLVLQP